MLPKRSWASPGLGSGLSRRSLIALLPLLFLAASAPAQYEDREAELEQIRGRIAELQASLSRLRTRERSLRSLYEEGREAGLPRRGRRLGPEPHPGARNQELLQAPGIGEMSGHLTASFPGGPLQTHVDDEAVGPVEKARRNEGRAPVEGDGWSVAGWDHGTMRRGFGRSEGSGGVVQEDEASRAA